MEVLYFAFGDADFYIIFDVPDNISAARHQRGRIDFSPPPFAGESISRESGNANIEACLIPDIPAFLTRVRMFTLGFVAG